MKTIINILGAIGLTATSTASLITCKTPKSDNNSENGGNKPEPTPELQQPPKDSNWKLITDIKNEFNIKNNNKYYFTIFQHNDKKTGEIKKFKQVFDINLIRNNPFKGLYHWDREGEPLIPTINKDTGEITEWKG